MWASWLIGALWVTIGFGLGAALVAALPWRDRPERIEAGWCALGLGLGVLGYGASLVALGGAVETFASWALLTGLAAAMVGAWLAIRARRLRAGRSAESVWGAWTPRGWTGVLAALVGAHLAINVLASLAPISFADTLVQHYALAKAYWQRGGAEFIPNFYHAKPYLMETYYLWALALGHEAAGSLMNVVFSAACALGVYQFSRRYCFPDDTEAVWRWMAVALFYGMPFVTLLSSAQKDSMAFTLFGVLALYAVLRFSEMRDASWLVVGGLAAGLGANAKIHGLMSAAAVGVVLMVAVALVRVPWRQSVLYLVGFAGVVGALASPWMIRNVLASGNPVYPHFYRLFGGVSWNSTLAAFWDELGRNSGLSTSLPNFLVLPWKLTLDLPRFGFSGGLVISPIFLICLPLLAVYPMWRRLPRARVRALVLGGVYCLAYSVLWFVLYKHGSYLVPVFLVLAPFAAYALRSVWESDRLTFTALAPVVAAVMLFGLASSVLYGWQFAPLLLGGQGEREFLARMTWDYDAMIWANENLPRGSKLLTFVNQVYYLDRDYLWANPILQGVIRQEDYGSWDRYAARLRELGITHVLVDSFGVEVVDAYLPGLRGSPGDGEAPSMARMLSEGVREGDLRQVYSGTGYFSASRTLGTGMVTDVAIYELKGSTRVVSSESAGGHFSRSP